MARIAENTVIVDGQEYKPGDVIPDFKSIKCVDTREPRKYQGLSADVSVLNDIIAKYASGGASCFMSDTGEYYEYDRKEKTWKLITNITERGFDSEKAYGALKHMLKNVTVSDEKIQSAVTNYLTVNPVLPGATTEQAQQIEQNKTDVASLGTILREKKPSYYKTVSEMQSDILLSKGMVAVTLGYYNENDGGGATYIINVSETNSSKINIKLNNGLYANIIILDKIVNVLTAGIKNDGITPVSDQINALIDNFNIHKLYFPSGVYLLDKKLICSNGCDSALKGNSNSNENYYQDGSRGNTVFKASGEFSDDCILDIDPSVRVCVENICFSGDAYNVTCDNNISTTGNIHNMYTETIYKQNLSGIIIRSAQCLIRDCFFDGFSDNGINAKVYNNIYNCIFSNCRIGIQAFLDNTVSNIICMGCGTGIMLGADTEHENTSFGNTRGSSNTVSNIRIDGMSKHGIEIYGYSNIVNTYFSDQVNYASVVMSDVGNVLTNAELSRCAQYSAGNTLPEGSNEQKKYCAVFIEGDCASCHCDFTIRYMAANDLNKPDSVTPNYLIFSNGYLNDLVLNIVTDFYEKKYKTLEEMIKVKLPANLVMRVNGVKYTLSSYLNNNSYICENVAKSRNVEKRTGMFYVEGENTFVFSEAKNDWIAL